MESNFYAATHYEIAFPKAAGSVEQATVSGLHPGTRYWFAIRASDEMPNWSGVSNGASAVTLRRGCLLCTVGLPSDVLGVEGLGDALFGGLAILALAGSGFVARRKARSRRRRR